MSIETNKSGPALIVVLSDGIRGHLFQSLGIARWIATILGTEIVELSVPLYSGLKRAWLMKVLSRFLPKSDHLGAIRWLGWAEAPDLLKNYRDELLRRKINGHDCLIISAGSSSAPFNLSLSKIMGAKNCVLMTPSVLGTSPFDWSVIPAHDGKNGKENSLVTLGAPNSINEEKLSSGEIDLLEKYPGSDEAVESWGVLVGGDDQNYRLDPTWAEMTVGVLLRMAEERSVDLYITTSRRTSADTEKRIKQICSKSDRVKMLLLASKDDSNPVPGILGHCERVFCTEDSVSMISEAATSHAQVYLLRTGRQKGWRKIAQEITSKLVGWKVLPDKFLWGSPRFDRMIEDFKAKKLIHEMPVDVVNWRKLLDTSLRIKTPFNEAERAAKWIIEGWKS